MATLILGPNQYSLKTRLIVSTQTYIVYDNIITASFYSQTSFKTLRYCISYILLQH